MAELILTDEEKADDSLLLWSDEALGKAVRFCVTAQKDLDEQDSIFAVSSAQILCSLACKTNATHITMNLTGVTYSDKKLGDWKITAEQIKPEPTEEG